MAKRSRFARNIGMVDRMFRFCIGIGLILLGTLLFEGTVGMILLIAGVVAVATAIIGFCPLYIPLGISTVGFPFSRMGTMSKMMAKCCRGSVDFPQCSSMMEKMCPPEKGNFTNQMNDAQT
jgi:hypothetical protein